MLLKFKTKNYKSFKEELIFSLIPAPKQKGLDYSILHKQVGIKKYEALSSAIIYGCNAAGKTNIIGAIDTFKNIVLRGNIRNFDINGIANIASSRLELIPNNTYEKSVPVQFEIEFIESGHLIDYSFTADLGCFLDYNYDRKIISEALKVNETLLFNRKCKELTLGDSKKVEQYFSSDYTKNSTLLKTIAENSLRKNELFLTNGFKAILSSKIAELISEWLTKKLIVLYRYNTTDVVKQYPNFPQQTLLVEKKISEAAKLFGINSNDLGYMVDGTEHESELCSVFYNNENVPTVLQAELFESYGTIRFINMFPIIADAIEHGKTIIADEFDASIHPMALMSIINLFHNDEINKNMAQLVFNTHNPIFLNPNLFRRDEIKFVEREEENHISRHYSLSDFETVGKRGTRKNEDYMKNYFVDRYGAIKDIDFTPMFEERDSKLNDEKRN